MSYLNIKVTKKILPSSDSLVISNSEKNQLSYNEIRINNEIIKSRINKLIFRNKNELIYFCLVLYKHFLDREEEYESSNDANFTFSFYKEISRIVVFSENKITSFYMPFIPIIDRNQVDRSLESRLNPRETISVNELIVLIEYFRCSIFLSFERDTLLEQAEKIEAIKNILSEETVGFAAIDEEKISKLVLELLFYDSSYLRYDVDFEHFIDINIDVEKERVFRHPPYHIDSDYRDAPSYKIGFDKRISCDDFLKLFQMDEGDSSMIIRSGYEPIELVQAVKRYKNSNK
jgi:hypothetical protein